MTSVPISVVVRTHSIDRLVYLRRALFSLMLQRADDMEVLICTQRFSDADMERLRADVAHLGLGLNGTAEVKFVNVSEPESGDIRGHVLNAGIKAATRRYIGFLDDDDVVYTGIYERLIDDLRAEQGQAAFGRCVRVDGSLARGAFYARTKSRPWQGRSIVDLAFDNFCPLHSYIFDRETLVGDLIFDTDPPYLEDYRLLLRLMVKNRFIFKSMDTDVCEYWFYESGLNTTTTREDKFTRVSSEWRLAREHVQRLKAELRLDVSLFDLELWLRMCVHQTATKIPGALDIATHNQAHEHRTVLKISPYYDGSQ